MLSIGFPMISSKPSLKLTIILEKLYSQILAKSSPFQHQRLLPNMLPAKVCHNEGCHTFPNLNSQMARIDKSRKNPKQKRSERHHLLDGLLQIKRISHTIIQERPCITKICQKMATNLVLCCFLYCIYDSTLKSVFTHIAQCKHSRRVHTKEKFMKKVFFFCGGGGGGGGWAHTTQQRDGWFTIII
jgi:hypothetical protein